MAASANIATTAATTQPWHQRLWSKAWSLPWIALFLALYVFTVPWIYGAIIDAYFIRRSWDHALPGLGTTLARRIAMGSHMGLGAAALLLGPTQFVASLRRAAPGVHRWCGRMYIICALGASAFGLAFIVLKRGKLVGGVNMAIAFGTAGIVCGVCAVAAYLAARSRHWLSHRAWVIRSFSQILAPMLYRYWYMAADVTGLYEYAYMPGEFDPSRDCDAETGICPLFMRPFDAVHCWTYWLSSLAVAELIVWLLPPMKEGITGKESDSGAAERRRAGGNGDEQQLLNEDVEVDYGGVVNDAADEESCLTIEANYSAIGLNALGVSLAVITSVLTAKVFTK